VTDSPARTIDLPAWTREAGVVSVLDVLGEARFVGGAVRDTLLGRPVGDLDLATPLIPDEVLRRLEAAGLQVIPTGLGHGTITVIADHRPIEVTTLRRDVETDGRHAIVAFGADWAADARRRDLTMNALFLDRDGRVWDPVGGLDDCLAGRVRFVGDPRRRIGEDVLRLLRFYRFQAHYGRVPADPAARAACRDLAPGITGLSGERIRVELLRLLAAPDPVPTLRLVIEDGVMPHLLPAPVGLDRLARLVALEPAPDPLRRLAALLPEGDPRPLADRLRLSVRERERLQGLVAERLDLGGDLTLQHRALHRLGSAAYRDAVLLMAAETDRPGPVRALLDLAETWPIPYFPLRGADALALGVPPGERIGELLTAVEAWWIAGDFTADRGACLGQLKALMEGSGSG
jgi:poly(A) polymerase